jgi:hemolysin D
MTSLAKTDRPARLLSRVSPRGPEIEFLPAALEIIERPVSPMPRVVAGLMVGFFAVAFTWSWFGSVDIIATAPGKIIPSGRAKVIQPFEIGTIKAIHVDEGQHVVAGDLLIELDPTTNQADRDRFASDLMRAEVEAARLEAQLARIQGDPFARFTGVEPALIKIARDQMAAQAAEQQAKLAAIDRQLAEKRADNSSVKATIAKLEASLPLLQKRADIRHEIMSSGYGNKIADLEAQQSVVEQKSELIVQRHHLDQTAEAVEALVSQRVQTEAEYRRTVLSDLTKAETQAAQLRQELRKATGKTELQRLTAPVDGTVQQLAVHTIGGVVTPAEQLMVIVPSNVKLEVEAIVENKDIGFVEKGQSAEIKIETFNFTRYGLLHGEVMRVSHDAVPMDRPATSAPGSTQSSVASAQTQAPERLAYVARISLDKATMHVGSKDIPLEPGEAVTVEIKTGQRRVLDFLLSPLQSYQHDGLRER